MNTDIETRITNAVRTLADINPRRKAECRRQYAILIESEQSGLRPLNHSLPRPRTVTVLAAALSLTVVIGLIALSTTRRGSAPASTSSPTARLTIRSVNPDPSTETFTWEHGYQIDGFRTVNTGRGNLNPNRDATGPENGDGRTFCVGVTGDAGCGSSIPPLKEIRNADTHNRAWVWTIAPTEAALVTFTDRSGTTSSQRPIDGIAIFPDATTGSNDGCDCTLTATDLTGKTLTSAHYD